MVYHGSKEPVLAFLALLLIGLFMQPVRLRGKRSWCKAVRGRSGDAASWTMSGCAASKAFVAALR